MTSRPSVSNSLVPSPSVVASPSPPPLADSGHSSVLSSSGIVKTTDPQLVVNLAQSPANSRASSVSPVPIPSVDVHPGSYTSMPTLDSFPPPMLSARPSDDLLYSTDDDDKATPPATAVSSAAHSLVDSDAGYMSVKAAPRGTAASLMSGAIAPATTTSSSVAVGASSSPLDPIVPAAAMPSPTSSHSIKSPLSNSMHRSNSLLHLRGTNKKLVLGMVGLPARGKCWAKGTRLRLYDGGVKKVEEFVGGEMLMGDDGRPRVVTPGSTTRGRSTLYEVRPTEKGASSFTVNSEHILVLLNVQPPHKTESCAVAWFEVTAANRMRRSSQRFVREADADADLAKRLLDWRPLEWEVTVRDYLRTDTSVKRHLRLYRPGPVTFVDSQQRRLCSVLTSILGAAPSTAQEDWAAWYLGLWINNGLPGVEWIRPPTSSSVISRLHSYSQLFGEAVSQALDRSSSTHHPVHVFKFGQLDECGDAVESSVARKLLHAYGLLDRPHVPSQWLCDTVEVRSRILAGFIDSCNHCHSDSAYELQSASHTVLSKLRDVALSLGISCGPCVAGTNVHPVTRETYSGFRMYLSGHSADALRGRAQFHTKCASLEVVSRSHGFRVVEKSRGEYYGFAVHGGVNRRFLLEDFTITHNTYIAQKLSRYLNWCSYLCQVFNIGVYRRRLFGAHLSADWFDAANEEGFKQRNECAVAALQDMFLFFKNGGQAAVFDGTNTTEERREMVRDYIAGHASETGIQVELVWIESLVHDQSIVDENIRETKLSSPDYDHLTAAEATSDFRARIRNYERYYEPLQADSDYAYIKLIDAGRQMITNKIVGYLCGKIVFFLMNLRVNRAPIYISRHGESQHNVLGLIGGDSELSPQGVRYAKALAKFIDEEDEFIGENADQLTVWTSTMRRTIQTASYFKLPITQWRALIEIQTGVCESMSYEEIAEKLPAEAEGRRKDKLRYRYPQGESYLDVIQRLEPCILELERMQSPVLLIVHRAVARCLLSYFMDIDPNQIPHLEVPLHTVMKLQPKAYECRVTTFSFPIPSVDLPTVKGT